MRLDKSLKYGMVRLELENSTYSHEPSSSNDLSCSVAGSSNAPDGCCGVFNDRTGIFPAYHSSCVSAGSGSGSPLNHKFRASARATLGSFGTRTPRTLECRMRPIRRSTCLALRGVWESRYRANSDTRTYRRVELESNRKPTNSGTAGSKLKRLTEGKSCTLPLNLGTATKEVQYRVAVPLPLLCSSCGINETYMDLDICEPCVSKLAGL